QPMRIPLPTLGRTLALALVALLSPRAAAEERTGEQIYKQMCVRCHGPAGEGTKKVPQPLTGDKSAAQLANAIHGTTPDDDPDRREAAGAKIVAAYIHDVFYSAAAQARIKPPRVDLARLTIRQYRNSVADLIASFRTPARLDDKHGLRGEYFNARN